MVVTQLHLCVPFFVGRFARETCTPLPTQHVHELCVPFFVGRFVRETCTPSPTHVNKAFIYIPVQILDREIHSPFMCPIFCREICYGDLYTFANTRA